MHRFVNALVAAVAVPGSALFNAPPDEPREPVSITERDVAASNAKAGDAYRALVAMWSNELAQLDVRFVAPRLVRYRGAVRSACGVMAPSNATYCVLNNTIYFDEVFVASQAALARRSLGTDGDMTAIGIIAHEMGHAVAMQLGAEARNSYEHESVADCLAGAFVRQSEADGSLEVGDIDEAIFGMAAAGDPTPEPTGNRRLDRRIVRMIARGAHGTREQRVENFRAGLEGGGAACLEELR